MTDADQDAEILALLAVPKTYEMGFRRLMTRYQVPLYRHIRRLVVEHEDADDVLQNTFVKVFRNIERFEGKSKLFTWLYRIATNEALTFIANKSKKNSTTSEVMQSKIVENLPADIYYDGNEMQLKLQKAIVQLPEKQQLIFKMKYYEELKYEQISEILGTSVGGLKASYHIAVKKIEEFIKVD